MIYEKPKLEIAFIEESDVIRTSLVPGGGGGPDISAPGGGLLPGDGGGSDITPLGGNWI